MESTTDTTRGGAILALLALGAIAFLLLLIAIGLGRWARRSGLGGTGYGGRLAADRKQEPMPDPWEESARRLRIDDETDTGDDDPDRDDDPGGDDRRTG